MRADRLSNLLMLLQTRGRTSAATLAVELDISVRTVYRDVAALEQAGVPMIVDRGRDGGFRLVDGYHSRFTGFSSAEAEAMPFMHLLAAASALGMRAPAQAARAKVIAALPQHTREHAVLATARFHLDPVDWYARPTAPPLLRAIATATWKDQVITIDYESWQRRRVCVAEPLGIVCKAAQWYLVARRRKRTGIYRIESMYSARVVAGRKVKRDNFDLERAWLQEVSRFEAELRRQVTRVRVNKCAMIRLNLLGADAAEAIRSVAPDKAGWRTADIWIESISHAASQLLSFGDDIQVLSPRELRAELAKRASRIAALYAPENLRKEEVLKQRLK